MLEGLDALILVQNMFKLFQVDIGTEYCKVHIGELFIDCKNWGHLSVKKSAILFKKQDQSWSSPVTCEVMVSMLKSQFRGQLDIHYIILVKEESN